MPIDYKIEAQVLYPMMTKGQSWKDQANQLRPNKKIPVFRVTWPYLNFLVKPRTFSRFSGKKYNYIHFERQNAFQKFIKLYFFSRKKIKKKKLCATLPKIFWPVTRNTLIFLFGLMTDVAKPDAYIHMHIDFFSQGSKQIGLC